MRIHLAQFKTFCEAHPIAPKVLIVPSMTVGADLLTALAIEGYSWINVRVETPRSLADKDAGTWLISEHVERLPVGAELFWIDDLIPQVVRDVGDAYFAQQASGLARSFLRTLRALRTAGIDAEEFEGHVSEHRQQLLGMLYRKYCAMFESEGVYDNAALYRRALARLKDSPSEDGIYYAILDATPLPGLAFQYVRQRVGDHLWRIGGMDLGAFPPVHCAGVRFADVSVPEVEGDMGAGGRMLASGLTADDAGCVKLREVLGAETEIRSIFRAMRERAIPLDQVEIGYTTENPYLAFLCDAVLRYEIPATFGAGMPVTVTHVGQALAGFYRWVGSGFDAAEWVSLCRAGLVCFGTDGPDAHVVATILCRARIGEGRARYFDALNRLEAHIQDRDGDGDVPRDLNVTDVKDTRAVMLRVFDGIPDGNEVDLADLVDAGIRFLNRFVVDQTALDQDARDSLIERLRDLKRLKQRTGAPRRLGTRLCELLLGHTFNAAAARPGHVSITPLDRSGYTGRKHLYIAGMDEGSFPGGATEDPLLLDGERAGLSGDLALHRTRPAEQVWHLVRALGMASGNVALLSCRKSLADGRENYPSALMQQAAEQMGMDGFPVIRMLPEDAALGLDVTESLLASHPASDYADAVKRAFPWLAQGQIARRFREWHGLTVYDGWLGMPTPELGITERTVFSASRLETLARCPYRYFLSYVLRIRPLEEVAEDPTRWLDPLAFGSLLHRLFRRFMETICTRGEKPDREQHAELMQSLLQAEIAVKQETEPVVYQAAFRADVKRLDQAAQVFLAVESEQKKADPVGFEISFGQGEAGGLNREEAVSVDLAKDVKFRIQGRIDRVDKIDEDYAIWDYKTGSMAQYDERDLLKRGTHLQWALYAYALDTVLKQQKTPGRVCLSGYVFPGDREHGRRLAERPPDSATLANALRPLFALAAHGGFFHLQKERECAYCPYKRVCEDERIDGQALPGIRETMDEDRDFSVLLDVVNQWMGV